MNVSSETAVTNSDIANMIIEELMTQFSKIDIKIEKAKRNNTTIKVTDIIPAQMCLISHNYLLEKGLY